MYTFTVFGVSYDVTGSYQFVKYAVNLMVSKYGSNFDVRTPAAIQVRGFQLGSRYGA